jgi:hypothetical protein
VNVNIYYKNKNAPISYDNTNESMKNLTLKTLRYNRAPQLAHLQPINGAPGGPIWGQDTSCI